MKKNGRSYNFASNFLMFRNWLIKNLILILLLPLTVLSFIFISYGAVIDKVILKNPKLLRLFELNTQLTVLSEIEIPYHVKSLGYDCVYFIFFIFFTWLLSHSFYCYFQLSHQTGSKVLLFFETIVLLLVFHFIISTYFSFVIIVLVYTAIATQIIFIGLYWGYSLMQEK